MKVAVRVVDAGNGAGWWAEGWHIFTSAVLPWMGVMLVYMILSAVMSSIPYVGSLGQWLLTPVFMGGLMLGCRSLEQGGKLRFEHLFEGFQGERFVPLMIIGVVNIGLILGIVAIAATGVFGFLQIVSMVQAGGDPFDLLERIFSNITVTSILAGLLILVILAVFAMLNWFAPALVALDDVPAVEAMKLSFMSCMRNWLPFLVYGAIGAAIVVAGGIVITVVVVAVGAGAFMSGDLTTGAIAAIIGIVLLVVGVLVVTGLVLGPIVFGSTYAGYRDTLAPDVGSAPDRVRP